MDVPNREVAPQIELMSMLQCSFAETWLQIGFNTFHFHKHRMTYEMGERTGINQRLEDRSKRFTYFVPRDKAWENSQSFYPRALRKLNSAEYDFEVCGVFSCCAVTKFVPVDNLEIYCFSLFRCTQDFERPEETHHRLG